MNELPIKVDAKYFNSFQIKGYEYFYALITIMREIRKLAKT
jgi:hypothetical protein